MRPARTFLTGETPFDYIYEVRGDDPVEVQETADKFLETWGCNYFARVDKVLVREEGGYVCHMRRAKSCGG